MVRNDLERSPDVPEPVLVHQALSRTPGLNRVASFGPDVGGEAFLESDEDLGRIVVNDGWQNEYPAVEIFALEDPRALVQTAGEPPVVVGGPEDLPDLVDLGVLDEQPTELAVDAGAWDPDRQVVLTDGFRDVERHFGRIHDGASATRAPDDPRRMPNRWADYRSPATDRWTTRARYDGAAAVEASSSMSDADALFGVRPGELPYAAVDSDASTAWHSNRVTEPGWWQLTFEAPVEVGQVTVTAGPDARERVRVRTPAGATEPATLEPGSSRTFTIDDPDAAWVRVEDASGADTSSLALAEVDVPGVVVRRTLVLPSLPAGSPAPGTIVLRSVTDARSGCVEVDGAVRCAADRAVASEEPAGLRRVVRLEQGQTYEPQLTVRSRPGAALDALVQRGLLAGITASSTGVPDPRASALAAVDGDDGTTWIADDSDLRPTLSLNWVGKRPVTGLELSVADDAPARLPTELTVRWPGGRRRVVLEDGEVRFPAVRTDRVTVEVQEAEPATSLDFDSSASFLPVGVGELRVVGVPAYPLEPSQARTELPCGSGPTIEASGRRLSTAVTASPGDMLAGAWVPARVCASTGIVLAGRDNLVDVAASEEFAPVALVLTANQLDDTVPTGVPAELDDPVSRTLLTEGEATDDTVVWLAENTNAGWRADQDRALEPVVVDGWQQGWRLDGSGAAVRTTFSPDTVYRAGLGAGGVSLLALVLLTLVPARRWPGGQHPPLTGARLTMPLAVLVAAGVGGLVAGTLGGGVALVAALVAVLGVRRGPAVAPWVLAAVLVPAVAAYAARPWGAFEGWAGALAWPHYLVVAVVASVIGASSSAGARPRGSRRWANRIAGRSTSR